MNPKSVLDWLSSLRSNRNTALALPLVLLGVFVFLWVLSYWKIYGDSTLLLPRDNALAHYPLFLYIVSYLKELGTLPHWVFTPYGGTWIEVLSNNYLFLLPYRLVGYLIASSTDIPTNLVYKFCFLILGQGSFLFGLYWFAKLLFRSTIMAWSVIGAAFFSAIVVTNIGHEHALATIYYLPFIGIALIRSREHWAWLVLGAALFGLSWNNHYPQLQVLYVAVLLIALLTQRASVASYFKEQLGRLKEWKSWAVLLGAGIAFFISAGPVLYSYFNYKDKLDSPYRKQYGEIEAKTYHDYFYINTKESSITPSNFYKYIGYDKYPTTRMAEFDDSLLYATPAVLFALLLILVLPIPGKGMQLTAIALLAVLSMGIYGPAPSLLWDLFPGMSLFRQWMFFLPFLNLHLIFLVAFALKSFVLGGELPKDKLAYLAIVAVLLILLAQDRISLLYSVPPIFLLLTKTMDFSWLQGKSKITLLSGMTLTWVLLGGALWTADRMAAFERGLSEVPFANISRTHSNDIGDPLRILSSYYRHMVVRPLGTDTAALTKMNQAQSMFWYLGGNKATPVKPAEAWTQSIIGGLRLVTKYPPKEAKSLLVLQHNDGQWRAKTDKGIPIHVDKSLLNTIEIPLHRSVTSVLLTRAFSKWYYLVALMWLPALLLLWKIIRCHSRMALP